MPSTDCPRHGDWPKHGELRGGDRYDRPSMAWVPAAEWQERQWDREERAFQRQANQGQLSAPRIISDAQGGVQGIQSMGNGQWYDSKSAMRAHYKRDGLIEVGNDSCLSRPAKIKRPDRAEIREAVGKAIATVKEMPDDVVKARARARAAALGTVT